MRLGDNMQLDDFLDEVVEGCKEPFQTHEWETKI